MLFSYILDSRVLLGLGIGLIIATVALTGFSNTRQLTRVQIEEKAKSYGMDYPSEFKVINKGDVSK